MNKGMCAPYFDKRFYGEIAASVPAALREAVKPARKLAENNGHTGLPHYATETVDYFWLPSVGELFDPDISFTLKSFNIGDGSIYAYFERELAERKERRPVEFGTLHMMGTTNDGKGPEDEQGGETWYAWTRTCDFDYDGFAAVDEHGEPTSWKADMKYGVIMGFCL